MKRRLLAVPLAAALAACGDGEGNGPNGTPSGFTPADRGSLVVPATSCTITGFGNVSVTALLLGFSSFPSLCQFVQDSALCGDVASSTVVTVAVVRARNASPPPGPIAAGTYALSAPGSPPTLEPDLSFRIATAEITQTNATCGEPANQPTATGGTLVITAVDATHVTGSVDVSLSDGSRFQTSFDAPVCASPVDICGLVNDVCTAPVCCPTSTTCP